MRPDVTLPNIYDIFETVIENPFSDSVSHYVTKTGGVSTFHIRTPRGPVQIALHPGPLLTKKPFHRDGNTIEFIMYLSGKYDGKNIFIVTFYSMKPPEYGDKELLISRVDQIMIDSLGFKRDETIEKQLQVHELNNDNSNIPMGEHMNDLHEPDRRMMGVAFVSPLPNIFRQVNPPGVPGNFCYPLVYTEQTSQPDTPAGTPNRTPVHATTQGKGRGGTSLQGFDTDQ